MKIEKNIKKPRIFWLSYYNRLNTGVAGIRVFSQTKLRIMLVTQCFSKFKVLLFFEHLPENG